MGTWVPVEMRERYDNSWGEVTTGRATYTKLPEVPHHGEARRPGSVIREEPEPP